MTETNAQTIKADSRLFRLLTALLVSKLGLTKAQIFTAGIGYDMTAQNESALNKQFERDKSDLQDIGFKIETVDFLGTNQEVRYRINSDLIDIPNDIWFSGAEYALLRLAAQAWRSASLSPEANNAILKLKAMGVEESLDIIGVAPNIGTPNFSFKKIQTALTDANPIRFDYLTPGNAQSKQRYLEPHALVQHEGRWHIHGYDLDANALRTFLLNRIVSEIVICKNKNFQKPEGEIAKKVLQELAQRAESNTAEIELVTGTDAYFRFSSRAFAHKNGSYQLHYTDIAAFAEELSAAGPEVKVLSPPDLLMEVKDCLNRVIELHRK